MTNYLGICRTERHKIFRNGRQICAAYESDLCFPIAQRALPWQPLLGPNLLNWFTPPSFGALTSRNTLRYRNSDLRRSNADDPSTFHINLVSNLGDYNVSAFRAAEIGRILPIQPFISDCAGNAVRGELAESRPQATCTKIGDVLRCEIRQRTDRQTNRHTQHKTFHPTLV